MSRAYLRLDTGYFERRLERGDAPGAIGAYIACLCLAESQPKRGRFRNLAILRALLTPPFARWVPFLLEHGDLIERDGRIYVEGWDEWQEGDWKVHERIARIRNRQRLPSTNGTVTPDTAATVVPPYSGGGKRSISGKPRQARRKNGEPIPLSDLLDEIVP